jgi:methyl-accepting chemotaxis protein
MATDYKMRVSAQDNTKKGFNSVNKNINSTQSAMKKLAGAFAGVFAVRQLVQFGNETLALADNIGKTADSIGVQTEFLQRYQFAAQQSGLATEEFNKGMQNFTKMVGQAQLRTSEAGRTLEKLGVQVKRTDGSVKGAEEVFVDLFTALDNVGSQFEKNAILADLMGRAGVKLAVMGKDGAEAMKELAASAITK